MQRPDVMCQHFVSHKILPSPLLTARRRLDEDATTGSALGRTRQRVARLRPSPRGRRRQSIAGSMGTPDQGCRRPGGGRGRVAVNRAAGITAPA
jgi:hypothetical protein